MTRTLTRIAALSLALVALAAPTALARPDAPAHRATRRVRPAAGDRPAVGAAEHTARGQAARARRATGHGTDWAPIGISLAAGLLAAGAAAGIATRTRRTARA